VDDLPIQVAFATACGSTWRRTITISDNSTPVDLTGLDWEFVIRPNATSTVTLVSVTTTPGLQGRIDVTPLSGKITITLNSAATATLNPGSRIYALWSNPGTSATCWIEGAFVTRPVAAP
jgi:hypothetical protein